MRARLAQSSDQRPRRVVYAEIAEAIGVSTSDVEFMDSRLSGPDMSLNAPVHESESGAADRQDFLVSEAPTPDETVGESIDGDRRLTWLRSALNVLNERELHIVKERRLQEDGVTLEALGERLGISKERVRQIENRALEKLRQALLREHPETGAFV
jgi:RNA polymerase sigma-32 factor